MKELIILVFIASLGMFINEVKADQLNLQEYFPKNTVTNYYHTGNGTASTRYTFGFKKRSSSLYNWNKSYKQGRKWVNAVTQPLLFLSDLSITELGGIVHRNGNQVTTYKSSSNKQAGLNWSNSGGLTTNLVTKEFKTLVNGKDIDQMAYSSSKMIEKLESYKPEYSNKTYTDVVHIVMYHGTSSNGKKVRCGNATQRAESDVTYKSYKNYNSYSIELWLAKGVGIVKQVTPFIENNKEFWKKLPMCSGKIFAGENTFTNYIVD